MNFKYAIQHMKTSSKESLTISEHLEHEKHKTYQHIEFQWEMWKVSPNVKCLYVFVRAIFEWKSENKNPGQTQWNVSRPHT